MMLRNRHELGLSSQQVQDLEDLRDGYQREAIRYQADIRVAEVELQSLLRAAAVDVEQVKVKLQEIEHVKTELRLARIRAIEQGKALLSSEQHEKLQALLGESRYSRLADAQFSEPTEDQP
jgi:Spy/CpxP family protein refolding chaperone